MEYISKDHHSPDNGDPPNFMYCWICGTQYDDICDCTIWQECDEGDNPIDSFIVMCKSKECRKILNDHPRLYRQCEWGGKFSGRYNLICGDCDWRERFRCTNPNSITNGGEGIKGFASQPYGQGFICGRDGCFPMPTIRNICNEHKQRE